MNSIKHRKTIARGRRQQWLMERRWHANQFNTSTAISLITLLLRRNGFHFGTVPAAGTRLEYFRDVWIVEFKVQCMIATDGKLGLIHVIYNIQVTCTQTAKHSNCHYPLCVDSFYTIGFLTTFQIFLHKHMWNTKGVLRMCCRCPRSQGGARSTDTGPAHEPAACSLPAAGSTQSTQFTCTVRTRLIHRVPNWRRAGHRHDDSLLYTQTEHTG